MSRRRHGDWLRATILWAAVSFPVTLLGLGTPDIISMEGIIADVVRHMRRTGAWLVPHLYGELYTYKPAGLYWAACASEVALGSESPWALRLPTALAGLALSAALFLVVGRAVHPQAGALAACAALTGVLVLQKSRLAEFDLPLAACVGIAIVAASSALTRPRPPRAMWALAYAALAAGVLVKGAPAIMLYAPGLLAAALLTRNGRRILAPAHLLAVLGALLVVAAYYLAVYAQAGPAAFAQPLEEARYRAGEWGPHSIAITLLKPFVVLAVFLPWTILLPLATPAWIARQSAAAALFARAAWGFLLGGIAGLLTVPTYETRYFLPLCTPVAILAGLVLWSPQPPMVAWHHVRHGLARAAALVAGVALAVFALQARGFPFPLALRIVLVLGALAALLVALRPPARSDLRGVLPMLTAALCVWAAIAFIDTPRRAAVRSLRGVAAEFAPHIPADTPVWLDMSDDQSSLVYYLARPAQTFARERGWPPAGSYLALLRGQAVELSQHPELRLVELARARGGGLELVLGRLATRPHTATAPAPSTATTAEAQP